MIISHKHKFVFIHIPKTAGSSVALSLENCGCVDIRGTCPTHIYEGHTSEFDQHITCQNLKKIFDKHGWNWDEYFKFAFVRNPYSRMVSRYFYYKKIALAEKTTNHWEFCKRILDEYPTYKHFIKDYVRFDHDGRQHKYVVNSDIKLMTDYIGRLENLQEDFNVVCDKIGIPRQELLHENKSKHKHYTEYYDDETRQIVAEKYKKDIEMFGYTFDPPTRVKKLVCLYTCEKDRKNLEEFKKTPLYTRMSNDLSMKVIEVHAGASETKYLDGKLYLSCKESYGELSVKTYEMIKYCVSNFEFDSLVKIDSSIFGYDGRRNLEHKGQAIQFLYNLGELEKMLFSTSWFDKHEDYGGAVLQDSPTERGFKTWGGSRGLPIKYDDDIPTTPHYTGKFYFLSNKLCQYIMNEGEKLAIDHAKNLGGSEDTFVGRMVGKYVGDDNWVHTRGSWKHDYSRSIKTQKIKKISTKYNLIKLPGDEDINNKVVVMSCKYKRDDVAFAKRSKLGCSMFIYGNRRKSAHEKDDLHLDYLTYIIDNYDNLPECVTFVHDAPFSPLRMDERSHRLFFWFVRRTNKTLGFVSTKSSQHPTEDALRTFESVWNKYVDQDPPKIFKGGAMFSVTRELILSQSKSWYCSMRSAVSFGGPSFGGLLGYSWHHVFKKTTATKVL